MPKPSAETYCIFGSSPSVFKSISPLMVRVSSLRLNTLTVNAFSAGQNVQVDFLVDAVEIAAFVEAVAGAIPLHRLLLGRDDLRIGVLAADAQVPAGRGIPPQHQAMGVVARKVHVRVDRHVAAHVAVVQGQSAALLDVVQRAPHQLEAPIVVVAARQAVLVIDRRQPPRVAAAEHVVHFDQHFGILGVNSLGKIEVRADVVFLASTARDGRGSGLSQPPFYQLPSNIK